MSRAALTAGLSLLWLNESLATADDSESGYQFDVSQRLCSRLDDWEDALDSFSREES